MIGGQLELSDLTADEASFLTVLSAMGRIICAPGSQVRANLIEQLVTRSGPLGVAFAVFRRLDIRDAYILGKVDFSDCIAHPASFDGCIFSDPGESLDISRSEIKDLRLSRCTLAGQVRGENSRVAGNLWFIGCEVEGTVNLMLASVLGSFIVDSSQIKGMTAEGISMLLEGIRIEGLFQISKSGFSGALSAREARVNSQAVVRESRLGLSNSNFGTLFVQKARFESELTIGPGVVLRQIRAEALRSDSDVILAGVSSNSNSLDLDFDRIDVRGGLKIFDVAAKGSISLRGASIASLHVSESEILAPGLNANGSRIPGSSDEDEYAIAADGIQVAGDVQLGPDLLTIGVIRLIDSTIGGQVQYERGKLLSGVGMDLQGSTISSAVFLDDMGPGSQVHLAAAKVRGIFIDATNIPHVALLRTEYGFINDRDGTPPSVEVACELLEKDPMGVSAVPYRRMARWFSEEQGDERASRKILIVGETRLARSRSAGFRILNNLWRWTVGYGYAPSRALIPFLVLVVLATITFAAVSGYRDVSSSVAYPPFQAVGEAPMVFNPFMYALSATVPFLPDFLSTWAPANVLTQILTVVFQALGWLLLTALVAGIANRLRRR